ncbi:17681_t:CDS:2 [Cetraspora pellucida]|uniref:17681_t:CDS:1 n=1 Tax=Cetraspora pellucida TaxID=1433469 RepID=A0ACA9L3D2_9GLOM|nr:17681_t:CDS:2 [Cetraspora pellucida]
MSNKPPAGTQKTKVQRHTLESNGDLNVATENLDETTSMLLESYKTYNGRQYLNGVDLNYILPSDELEFSRSTLSHILRKHLWNNFRSPINEKLNIGHWVMDMGSEYPSSTFIGIDIDSSNFPSHDRCPSNVCFLTCNAIHGVPFPPNTFDFVNVSMMWCAFSEPQWIQLIKDLVRVLKYDGWIEFLNPNTCSDNPGKVEQLLFESASKVCLETKGVNIAIYKMIPKYLEAMDELDEITCLSMNYPSLENIKRAYESIAFLPKYIGKSKEDFDKLLIEFYNEVNESNPTWSFHRQFAKKVHNID